MKTGNASPIIFLLFWIPSSFFPCLGGTIPDRLPGNPDYLVRVIYFIPKDRLLDYDLYPQCASYTGKVNDAVLRIRTALETLNDFLYWQINDIAAIPDPPGCRLNFERENQGSGPIRVIVMHGSRPTEGTDGYWGGDEGLNGYTIFNRVVADVFPESNHQDMTQKTVFFIIPDVIRWDNSIGNVRGHTGGGSNDYQNSSGWGGIALASGFLLPFLPPDPGDPVQRKARLEDYLSSTTAFWEVPNPYTGALETWNLGESVNIERINPARCLSVFHGLYGHELLHTFGVQHFGTVFGEKWMDIMSLGYKRFGHAVSMMYGFSDDAYPFDSPGATEHIEVTNLHEIYCHYISYSPYFCGTASLDKTDPRAAFSYPPYGYVWEDIPEGVLSVRAAEEVGGSGLNAGYLYFRGYIRDMELFKTDGITTSVPLVFSGFPDGPHPHFRAGNNLFSMVATDRAGNRRGDYLATFMMSRSREVEYNTVFVGPGDDPREGQAKLGSFENSYQSIQEAIEAVEAQGPGTVFLKNGLYTVNQSILPRQRVNLVGESVGGVVLDGQGDDQLAIILSDNISQSNFSNTSATELTVISNLTFANAGWGIRKPAASFNSYNFAIANCVFSNLAQTAIHIEDMSSSVRIMQNTIVNCGSGIILKNWPNRDNPQEVIINPLYTFDVRNNLVVHLGETGNTGIELEDIQSLRTKGRSGWNNSYGFLSNYKGSDQYDEKRLEGEISLPVQFVLSGTYDFRLQSDSAGVWQGDPLTANKDGTRRDIGAFMDIPKTRYPVSFLYY